MPESRIQLERPVMRRMKTLFALICMATMMEWAQSPATIDVAVNEGTSMSVTVSPDGQTLAIDLQGSIWTLPASGGRATRITDVFNDARQPAWSPDVKSIAFFAYRDDGCDIWAIAPGRVLYSLTNHKGCVLLTGEYGCGKTALVRKVIETLDPDLYELALINYPIFSSNEFLREVLFQYGAEAAAGTKLELFHRVSAFGYQNLEKNKQNVLVIDEAQLIEDSEIFEQIRLLLNLQLEDKGLVSIFLVGQPELRERVMTYPQLDQRIGVRYHIHYFGHDDVVSYIRHRLRIAGEEREIFTSDAYLAITRASHGVPRRINNICDFCLLDRSAMRAESIDETIVNKIQ